MLCSDDILSSLMSKLDVTTYVLILISIRTLSPVVVKCCYYLQARGCIEFIWFSLLLYHHIIIRVTLTFR